MSKLFSPDTQDQLIGASMKAVAEKNLRQLGDTMGISETAGKELASAFTRLVPHAAHSPIAVPGMSFDQVGIVVSGWVARVRHLSDDRRQIIQFLMRGDIITPSLSEGNVLDHHVVAMTHASVLYADWARVFDILYRHHGLEKAAALISGRDAAILRETVVNLGKHTALERVAHFLIDIRSRWLRMEDVDPNIITMPVTQKDLSDRLGLSLVHFNKTLRKMETMGLIQRQSSSIAILEPERLEALFAKH